MSHAVARGEACAHTLEALFQQCFYPAYQTRLRGGASEPLYLPAGSPDQTHTIYYREDFFASALHEVAHWCIAGPRRRQLTDYGYWYHPDGRSREQQLDFEQAEVRPQAVEWHFALACNWSFRISNDNLAAAERDSSRFVDAVRNQARRYCQTGLPQRAMQFQAVLAGCFAGCARPRPEDFDRAGA